jgi:ClpP class serine protease
LITSDSKVSIASTKAPKKRPDVTTDEGKAMVQEQLDPMHDLVAESIADGRGTTTKKVNANFGQGAMVLAEQALKAGMIDSIGSAPQQSAPEAAETKEVRSMDLQKLKTEYPAVYDAAVAVGRDTERDRVCAHLKMGAESGDMETAVTAITDGSDMTMTLTATYMSAARNKALTDARVDDNQEVTVEPEAQGGDDFDRQVAKAMEAGAEREGMIHG